MVSILIVTPDYAFGELLRVSLEEGNLYEFIMVKDAAEALEKAKQIRFSLAILDSELPDQPVISIANSLKSKYPEIRLVVIPPQNDPKHPLLAGISPDGYISRPFFAPDILQMIESLIPPTEASKPDQSQVGGVKTFFNYHYPWPFDSILAEGALIGLQDELNAEAVMMTHSGEIIASRSRLSDNILKDAADLVSENWDGEQNGDLAQFMKINASLEDVLVYTTPMDDNLLLTILQGESVSFSKIRHLIREIAFQLREMVQPEAKTLEGSPPSSLVSKSDQENLFHLPESMEAVQELFHDQAPGEESVTPEDHLQPADELSDSGTVVTEEHVEDVVDEESGLEEIQQTKLAEILAELPPPDPEVKEDIPEPEWIPEAVNENIPETQIEETEPPLDLVFPWDEEINHSPKGKQESPTTPVTIRSGGKNDQTGAGITVATKSVRRSEKESETENSRDQVEATLPIDLEQLLEPTNMDSDSPIISHHAYTCILIPRLRENYLTGDLAEHIAKWVPEICQTFSWQNDTVNVRPAYLLWTAKVGQGVSPGKIVRAIRQRTSERIFSQFPSFQTKSTAKDFWASGYLVVSGSEPPSQKIVSEFIQQARTNQAPKRRSE